MESKESRRSGLEAGCLRSHKAELDEEAQRYRYRWQIAVVDGSCLSQSGDTNAASEIAPIGWSAAEQQRIPQDRVCVGPPVVGIGFYNIPCEQR